VGRSVPIFFGSGEIKLREARREFRVPLMLMPWYFVRSPSLLLRLANFLPKDWYLLNFITG
jgi:hypothetical protein